ncbi:hypothetical protein ACEWY4_024528 [Coilia grayii]|uniref:MADF domain-containing protein n=1 Tax=Coilia grayii TaxID=363190 RepID=A0ABD1J0K8_9TELE
MYGRVSRLPVDMVFRQVLKDPVVSDYNTYAGKLMASHNVAATIAQQHAKKQQQRQADGYNKRARGTHLNVGDRVLLANKAERGKRKLADKWEPTIYTVTDRNPQTHVYKLRDESGRTKVVHCNLMLDVSFLPIAQSTSEDLDSGALDAVSECDSLSIDAVSCLAVDACSWMDTCSWINEMADAETLSGEDAADSEMEHEVPHSLPAEECKKKWKGLRDTLRKERRKEKERRRSGAEGGVARPWRYKEVMGFLNPFMEDRQTSSNVEGPESEEEGVEEQEQGQGQGQGQASVPREREKEPEAPRRKRRHQSEGEVFEERLLKVLETVSRRPPPPPPEDADSLFFKSLLEEFRSLSQRTRQDLKFEFHRLIYEAKRREDWGEGSSEGTFVNL